MFLKVLFTLSAFLTISCAIGVIALKNIMHACIALLGSLIGVAGLYVTLGADFVAAVQFMVYVGGVVILMLFAVMLTGNEDSEDQAKSNMFFTPIMGSRKTVLFGLVTAMVFLLSVVKILWRMFDFGEGNLNPLPLKSTVNEIGTLLLTDHVLAFEMSSVLLLGALVGAAIIARPKALLTTHTSNPVEGKVEVVPSDTSSSSRLDRGKQLMEKD